MATLTVSPKRSRPASRKRTAAPAKSVRRNRIARAKARIESGYYQQHDALTDLVILRLLSDLQRNG